MTYSCVQCGAKLVAMGQTPDRRERQFECGNPECRASGWVRRDQYGREGYRGSAFEEPTNQTPITELMDE